MFKSSSRYKHPQIEAPDGLRRLKEPRLFSYLRTNKPFTIMSWSVSFIGTPDKIVVALENQSGKLSDQSKVEYDSVLPHLIGIVRENFGDDSAVLHLNANGHGYAEKGEQKNRNLTVELKRIYGILA